MFLPTRILILFCSCANRVDVSAHANGLKTKLSKEVELGLDLGHVLPFESYRARRGRNDRYYSVLIKYLT
jgi:hypothetical protein